MDSDLISVIIPVYNAQNYIEKCIDSLIKQDYTNLEIIIVNDGSTDNSEKICKSFADKDSRIKYFSKPNGGPAAARNYALDRMTGKYVTFLDNDDWILPNYVSELYNLLIKYNADFSCCYEAHEIEQLDNKHEIIITEYSKDEFAEKLIPDEIGSKLICRLFKSELFDGLRMPEDFRSVEDMRIFPQILMRSKKVVSTNKYLYYYYVNPAGASAVYSQNPSRSIEVSRIFIERYDIAKNWVPDRVPLVLDRAVWWGVSSFCLYNEKYAEIYGGHYRTIQEFFKAHESEIACSPLIARKYKVSAKLLGRKRFKTFFTILRIIHFLKGK